MGSTDNTFRDVLNNCKKSRFMKGKKFQSQSHIDVHQLGQKPLVEVSENTHLLTEKDDEDSSGDNKNEENKIN